MKKQLFIIIVGCMMVSVGCSHEETTTTEQQDQVVQEETKDTGVNVEGQNDTKENETNKTDKATETVSPEDTQKERPYYGSWKITKRIAENKVYALSEEEIKECIGKVIGYKENAVVIGGESEKISGYEEKTISNQEFYDNWNINLSDIGVDENELMEVSVKIEGNMLGAYFYSVDDNKLIIVYEGVFFEATPGTNEEN